MVSIVLASHGDLAEGLKMTGSMVFGDQPNVATVSLMPSMGPDDFRQKVEEAVASFDDPEDVLFLVDLWGGTQKILMAQKKDYFKKRYDDSGYITISYTLKNGEKVNRVYHTTDDFNPHKQCKAIMAEENKPQNIINAIMQCDTTDITFIDGSAEQYDDKYVDVLKESFNGKVAADIFEAVKKDVEAGVMQEYNLQRMLDGVDKDNSYMYNLMLNFTVPKGNRIGKSWNVYDFTWYEELLDILGVTKEYSDFGDARSDGIETYSVNISFGENCTNLIAVLKENGLISSKEPLLTYE